MARTKGAVALKPKVAVKNKPQINKNTKDSDEYEFAKEPSYVSDALNHVGKSKCEMCGFWYDEDKGYSTVRSRQYDGNNHKLHTCKKCVETIYKKNLRDTGSPKEAIKRICMRFDVYFSENMYNGVENTTSASEWYASNYIAKMMLPAYENLTYSSYLDEISAEQRASNKDILECDYKATGKDIKFWGFGFEDSDYMFLNNKYSEWITSYECNDKAQQTIFQNLCILELQKIKALRSGDDIDKIINCIDKQLGSANLKPIQNKKDNFADQNTFGTLIDKWENEEPIPEPKEEWKDVDGIVKYITVWFFGHLCKMLNIKNSYCRMYEEEIKKLTVERPNLYEDDESAFNDIFTNAEKDGDDDKGGG